MQRGTKEFYEIKKAFEGAVESGFFGYMSGDLTEDDFNSETFYANGEVNQAFRIYMAGYAAGMSKHRQ